MDVLELAKADRSMVNLVGGKAAGLGELIGLGERVPDGFCLTTTAYRSGCIPEAALLAAYERLGGGTVAVRSSATAEDLPAASFAGQQDTFLDVAGEGALVDAVRRSWESLHTDRAVAYRRAHGIEHEAVDMAVVVQRMVDAVAAGVLFTANPVTGCRAEMVVDAAPGLGTSVVDGTVVPDHYVLPHDGPLTEEPVGRQPGTAGTANDPTGNDPTGNDGFEGCLDHSRLADLRAAGRRLQEHFGHPQDVEWAFDRDGTLWLLQSRPITTLFPLPPDTGRPQPRVYVEFGHVQGMLRPFTPMGMSALKLTIARMATAFGITVDPVEGPAGIVAIGGRLYADLTGFVRDKRMRASLPRAMGVDFGPRAQAVMERVLDDPRFSPQPGRAIGVRTALGLVFRTAPRAVAGIVHTLARPAAARARVSAEIEEVKRRTAVPHDLTAAQQLDLINEPGVPIDHNALTWPVLTGLLVSGLPQALLRGIADDSEVNAALTGMPHNVTTEMDLALWRLSQDASAFRELLLATPPGELASRYHAGLLPDLGLAAFLQAYGHRAAAEVDIGIPAWDEDPAPVFAALANYLRLTDPEQAPDRRFERAAAEGEAKLTELLHRARRRRPIRGRLAGFFLRRARELGGVREAGKFAGLYPLRQIRRRLLPVGAELAERGLLGQGDDIMFLTLPEAREALEHGHDHQSLVAARRATYERELRRRHVPIAVLSDGTDVEALVPPPPSKDDTLVGMPAAPGSVRGAARVVHDPATAHLEPGEILVAPTTDPGWTPLFLTAGGLVTETGAAMAHGPTVAREYGIPAVICVRQATELIRTGQDITIDGAAGTVTLNSATTG